MYHMGMGLALGLYHAFFIRPFSKPYIYVTLKNKNKKVVYTFTEEGTKIIESKCLFAIINKKCRFYISYKFNNYV